MAGLRVGQAYGGVPPTWVWVVGVSPQILEHPTSICDTGVNVIIIISIASPYYLQAINNLECRHCITTTQNFATQ